MDFAHPEVTAKAGIDSFQRFLKSIGMPVDFAELGAKEDDIPAIAHNACYGDGGCGEIGGFVKLKEQDVVNIYKLMI